MFNVVFDKNVFFKSFFLFVFLFFVFLFFSSCSSCDNPLKCSIQGSLEKIGINVFVEDSQNNENSNISIVPYIEEQNNNGNSNNDNNNNNSNSCNLVDKTVSYKKCVDVGVCKTVSETIQVCKGEAVNVEDECSNKFDCV